MLHDRQENPVATCVSTASSRKKNMASDEVARNETSADNRKSVSWCGQPQITVNVHSADNRKIAPKLA